MTKWTEGVITDRTAADIAGRTSKAFFNVSTWLRIYGNSQIANQLTNIYLSLTIPFTELTAPDITHFPTADEINSLVENIDLCRAAACLPDATGIVALSYNYSGGSGGTAPDYTDVNAWESDVQLIRDCLTRIVDYLVSCGVANCGQTRFYQNRWHGFAWVQPAVSPVRRPRCGDAPCGAGMTRQNSWRHY